MSGGELHGKPTRVWGHGEYRKIEKRPYLYEDEWSKSSCKKHSYDRNYSMCIDGQQNVNRERGGGQFSFGRERLLPDFDQNEFHGNNRHFSGEHYNYINESGNIDKKGNIQFGMERNHKSMEDGKFGTVGDDSEKESIDSGSWSYQGNNDETLSFDNEQNHYWRQGGPWSPRGRGYRLARGRHRGCGIGHQEKSPLHMSLKEKIHTFGLFLKNDIPKANAIQTIENGLARSRLGLKSNFHVDENKTGKPPFTGVLKLSGVFMGRSSGFTKKETKHKAYETALDTLIQKSVDEIFQLKDPGFGAERDKEVVSANLKLETTHNTRVVIRDAESAQAGNSTVSKNRDEEVASAELETNHNTHVQISDAEIVQAGNNRVVRIRDKEVVSAKFVTNYKKHVQSRDAESVQAGSSTVAKERDEEVVSAELETNHNTHVQISDAEIVQSENNDAVVRTRNEEVISSESGGYHNTLVQINADSVQTGEYNTQIINIPPGEPVNIDQRGNANNVTVNIIMMDQERRPSVSLRGSDRYIDLRIQMNRQDGLTVVHAEDLENLGLEALRTEEGHQLVIRSIEGALDVETDSISKGSIIICLRPKSKDSISKLKAAIESEQLHKILVRIVELEKVRLAVLGSHLILNITVYVPMEGIIEEDKSFTEKGSICIRLKSSSEDLYSRLKTKVETGHLQKILARISEIEPVHSALSGIDLVMNVTASVTEGNERPLVLEACTWKSQDQVKLLVNDSSNIDLNTFPDTPPCRLCKNWMKCLHHSIEAQPNTQFHSTDKSSLKSDPAPLENNYEDGISKLRGDLIKAYRNLRCVQVSPIFEKMRCDIDSIYVDLVIEKKQHGRNTEETKYVSTLCKDAQPYTTEVINVTSYKQIFLDERGSKLKRIYLCGKGGLGKTTFCRKVLHAWCNAHEGRAVASGDYFQDEAVLQMFDLLFYINLREVSFEENLIEAMCAQFPLEKVPSKNILGTQLKFNGDKVLFILDGLDEMIVKAGFIENVVTCRVYPNCCFLVSSRPWKISHMELHEGAEIDLLLCLKGFSQRNAQEFAKKLFENCYKDGNAVKQFTEDIACNKLVTQLIHVPLLLLFLVQVWYENERSLPSKLHELYILFLNLMTDKLKEKHKRDPNHRQMRFTVGDIWSSFPSKISQTSFVVNFGEGFLLSLCEVAHHLYLSSEKENSLIFEETNLLNALGERGKEKLNVALDLGILSVTNSMFSLKRETSVSFLHETIQEFFTALCLIVKPEKFANFISSMADLNEVLLNENIIVFLVGLMPKLGNRVLEKLNELWKDDLEILWSEEGLERYRYRELDIINKIYLRCKEEVSGEDVLLNVSGLCLDQSDFDLQYWNPAFLQSLDLIGTQMSHVYVNLRGFTRLRYLRLHSSNCELYLPESDSLSCLIIDTMRLSSSCCDALSRTLTHCTKLERLCIHNTDIFHCLLDLSKMTELTVLDMSGVILFSSCCDVLGSTLRHCTKLERLCIHDTDLHNCLLDLSDMTELTVLDMSRAILSSSCCDVLGSTLTHCTKLERLCIHDIDLHHCVLDLSNMTELTVLDMSRAILSSSCCDVLGSTLTHCTKLERLCIHDTHLHNCLLDLSNMTELTVLDMSGVILSSSCCDVLGSTLTHCTKLERLCIHDIDLHHCVLDLSNMTELTVLDMSGVILSSSCCDVLGSTLTHCTKLERLCIHDTDLHHCVLDLSDTTELTVLDMSRVTLSSSCCDVLGSTLAHCTKLEKLSICDTDLHHCLLDLSNMTKLTVLDMSGVTLSSSCCDVLVSTLSHCTKLEKLSICDTDLHHCLLDLSNMTKLTVLDMSEVGAHPPICL